jgi:hypothetical protein
MTQERVADSEPPETPVVANDDPDAPVAVEDPQAEPATAAETPTSTLAQEMGSAPLSAPAPTDEKQDAVTETPAAAGEPPVPPLADVAPPSRGGKFPTWLGLIALALVPAVIVGLVVFFLGSSSDSSSASGVLDGFIRLGNDPDGVVFRARRAAERQELLRLPGY